MTPEENTSFEVRLTAVGLSAVRIDRMTDKAMVERAFRAVGDTFAPLLPGYRHG